MFDSVNIRHTKMMKFLTHENFSIILEDNFLSVLYIIKQLLSRKVEGTGPVKP